MFDYTGGNRKVGLIKLEEKICDVQDMRVSDLAFPHTKFGLVRMTGSRVKRAGGGGGGGAHFNSDLSECLKLWSG